MESEGWEARGWEAGDWRLGGCRLGGWRLGGWRLEAGMLEAERLRGWEAGGWEAGRHLGGIWELPGGSWKQSWGSEAPDASEREKVAYLSAKMQKFLFFFDFTMCF